MKVICSKEELLIGSQIVQTVVSPRSTLPILSNFLLETKDTSIKFSSTDLEVGVSCMIKGEVLKEGSITIPAKRFGEIVKELPNDKDIEIKADDTNQINIKCGKSKFVLMGLPKTDYPVLPAFPEEGVFEIPVVVIKNMLKRTAFAVSTDETRYVLNGVYIVAENGHIKMVATDGRRLAFVSREGFDKKLNKKAIIPAKAVNELQRVLSTTADQQKVRVGITENQIAFQMKDITLISRLIDGTFPNYEQVIPKKSEHQVQLKTKEALSVIRQMALLVADKSAVVKCLFSKGILKVSASAQGLGSGEAEMDALYEGPNIEMAFNPSFVIDILKNMDEDDIVVELTNPLNPAILRPLKDTAYICVIMPMRI